ncbi:MULTISPECIES: hypothetical protein [Paenibacillus]|uniref:hypothetical protein n=1 Tax=Paenibacillus TaxID=44249 RepID=UPI001C8D0D2E|nr:MULTISPECIES: hypothetical protein [Paenibacillus]MBY0216825.1 hypothetical protein [Paenibacillus illinoisensis]WJH27078.1 hypothetical protein N6H13_17140 [Paenibacillus sp. CC-CFT742]
MKLLQWFAKIVLTVMLVSSLTLLTTGLIVQSYVKSLLASFNIEWEGQPLGLTSMFQGALGGKASEENKPGAGTTDQPTGAEEEQVPEDAISVMGNGTSETSADNGSGNTGSGSDKSDQKASAEGGESSNGDTGSKGADPNKAPEGAAGSGNGTAAGNGTAGTSGHSAGSGNDDIVVSPDDITGTKDKLPLEEKEKIFSLLMAKLPQNEMQQISGAMEDGLTEQELRDIEQVISKYLTSEEYDNLMEVLQAE